MINVISFFDGMSAGQEALRQLGVPVANYFAIEIDEDAINVTQKNFPKTIQVGNITHITEVGDNQISSDYTFVSKITGSNLRRFVESLPPIDLVFAGSPCQGFSQAGKGKGFDDARSRLFFNFIQIFNAIKKLQNRPNLKFFFENVKMRKEWMQVITNHLKVQPLKIDAREYSPCARSRLYWTNLEIPNSILTKYSNNSVYKDVMTDIEVSRLIPSNIHNVEKSYKWSIRPRGFFHSVNEKGKPISKESFRTRPINAKMFTLKALGGGWGAKAGLYERYMENPPKDKFTTIDKNHVAEVPSIEACEKGMGFSPGYTIITGNSANSSYKMLGNSWSVFVVKLLIDAYCHRKGWIL
jgi:site-specific DNA-cytosine methylase